MPRTVSTTKSTEAVVEIDRQARPRSAPDRLVRRVLGIDPGLSVTGWGYVELEPDEAVPRRVVGGIIRLKAKAPMSYRLAQLHEDLVSLLDELPPEVMVVEQLFSHYRHVRTAILMGHARGVVLLAGASRGVRIDELQPTEVKKAITGNGHAGKVEMQLAVMSQCRLPEPPSPPDVADGIAQTVAWFVEERERIEASIHAMA